MGDNSVALRTSLNEVESTRRSQLGNAQAEVGSGDAHTSQMLLCDMGLAAIHSP